jgi:pimeloyl-ACP methyl ester carboxylesterase
MAQTSSRSRRGKSSRKGRGLKITIAVVLAFLILIVLNAFALNNETESASPTVDGATLVETTSGPLQVLDTGPTSVPADADAAGERLPIVLIHGSGGAINWWGDLIPLLRTDHRVLAIDMLGYGGSEKPDSGYSIEDQAGLVAQVLAGTDVDKAVIVGHSLGGKVATALAESSPDLVAGVTIIDTGPDSSYGTLTGGAKLAQKPLIGPAMWRVAPDFMIRKNVSQGFAPGYDVPDKYVEDVREMTYPAYHQSFEEQDVYTDAVPLNERLEKTGKPLLIIFGAEDQIFSAREALSAYAAIPGVKTVLIEGSGHSPQIEAPEKTATEILTFADSLAPKPEPEPKPDPEKSNKNKNNKKQQGKQQQNEKQDDTKSGNQQKQDSQKRQQDKQAANAN